MKRWDPSMTIGVAVIDAEHQEILRRAEALDEALAGGQPPSVVVEILAYLGGYTREHFAGEARLMREHGYPDVARHLEEHAGFLRRLESLQREVATAGPSEELAMRLNETISDWTVKHVGTTDVALGDFLRGSGPPRAG